MRTAYSKTALTMWVVAAGAVAITLIVLSPQIQVRG